MGDKETLMELGSFFVVVAAMEISDYELHRAELHGRVVKKEKSWTVGNLPKLTGNSPKLWKVLWSE